MQDFGEDFVRIEIETALDRGLPVILLLVEIMSMPSADLFPPSLNELAYLNAVYVDEGKDFHVLMDELSGHLRKIINTKRSSSWRNRRFLLFAAFLGFIALTFRVRFFTDSGNLSTDTDSVQNIDDGNIDNARWSRSDGDTYNDIGDKKIDISTHKGYGLVWAVDTKTSEEFKYYVEAGLVSGETELVFGIVFGLKDANNYYLFRFFRN